MPVDIRAEAPLEPGERILLFARDIDGALAVGTDRALRHQVAGDWSRHGWEQLTRVTWHDESRVLTVTGAGAGRVAAIPLHVSDGARLAEFARERIEATFLLSTLVPLAGHAPARVTARRRPVDEQLTWQVNVDEPGAAVDPATRAQLTAAISELRAHIGM